MSTTLLREIQRELSSRDVDIATVLRKCKILARRLHSESFAQWVEWELNGYPQGVEVPPYRTVTPHSYANFSNGVQVVNKHPIAVVLLEEKWRRMFEPFPFRDGIPTVKALAAGNGGEIDRTEFRFLVKGKAINLPCSRFWSEIPEVELGRIISSVISRVLDFTLEIEAENPDAGEASADAVPVAQERVSQLVTNHFYGTVGNVAQNSRDFSQAASIDTERVREVVAAIEQRLDDLNSDRAARKKVEAHIATITAQLDGGEPNTTIIREAGHSLRAILENLAASAITNPSVWQAFSATLHKLL